MALKHTRIWQAAAAFVVALTMLVASLPAIAAEPIRITEDDVALNLSGAVTIYRNQGQNFQVSTAPGPALYAATASLTLPL